MLQVVFVVASIVAHKFSKCDVIRLPVVLYCGNVSFIVVVRPLVFLYINAAASKPFSKFNLINDER